jgi:mono/diheme cytochrome c family protein
LLFYEVYEAGKKVKTTEPNTPEKKVALPVTDGKALFQLKCAACHSADKDGYGPALKGVTKKRNNVWLHLMIRDGMELVRRGDKDALAIYNQWQQKKHPKMDKLTNEQVQVLIDYLRKLK